MEVSMYRVRKRDIFQSMPCNGGGGRGVFCKKWEAASFHRIPCVHDAYSLFVLFVSVFPFKLILLWGCNKQLKRTMHWMKQKGWNFISFV